jgi:glutamine amidotransferase
MCRHIGYLGPPITFSELAIETPHSLVAQSYAPRDMRGGGLINADGFGIGWFPDDTSASQDNTEIARYRRATPIWSDESLPTLARAMRSTAMLAALRSATIGMPVVETACAPYTDGRWLFSHNGVVLGWPDSVCELASALPMVDLLTLEAPTDSALLWALVRHRLAAVLSPAAAVRSVVLDIEAAAPGSRLNLLLLDRSQLVASTVVHALSYRQTATAVVVSSEPLDDDPGWISIPDRQLVVATATDVHINPIEG